MFNMSPILLICCTTHSRRRRHSLMLLSMNACSNKRLPLTLVWCHQSRWQWLSKRENICKFAIYNTSTHFGHGVFKVFAVRRDGPVFLATCTVLVSLNKVQWLHFTGVVGKFVRSDVTFLLDPAFQKLLKSVIFWLSHLNKSSAVAEMGVCAPFAGGGGSPSNTMWPGPRSTSVLSGVLIHPAIWPQ